jgi:hypothetical protein
VQARWIGYDADSTHAHRVYWPGKNSILVKRNIKFVSPTIIINAAPPSYASTMGPAQVTPAPSPPSPLASIAPSQLASPQASPPTLPTSVVPPSTSISQAPDLSDDEAEVEHTIMPQCITVLTVPSASPAQPHCSGCTTHSLGYY